MTDEDIKFRQWFIENLNGENCTIAFDKKDGSLREMFCTLSDEVIIENPEYDQKDYLRIYDLKAQAYRSFIWDNLISYRFEEQKQEVA